MKGRILGFTPSSGSGAISTENGERCTFVAAQWRSEKPIVVGTQVDFAEVAGVATEIYPVTGAAPITAADIAASPAVQKLRSLATATLVFPFAALLLIATFMPALSSPVQSVSLWGIGGIAKMLSASPLLSDDASDATERLAKIDDAESRLRQSLSERGIRMPTATEIKQAPSSGSTYGMLTDAGRFKELAQERAKLSRQVAEVKWRNTLTSLLVLRFLVPIGACVLIWLAWSGGAVRKPAIATGAASIVTALIIYLYRGSLFGHSNEGSLGAAISRQFEAVIAVGFGTYLIGLIGVGLMLAGMGVVRNPLEARS